MVVLNWLLNFPYPRINQITTKFVIYDVTCWILERLCNVIVLNSYWLRKLPQTEEFEFLIFNICFWFLIASFCPHKVWFWTMPNFQPCNRIRFFSTKKTRLDAAKIAIFIVMGKRGGTSACIRPCRGCVREATFRPGHTASPCPAWQVHADRDRMPSSR